jgi:hypothetical protein
MANRELGQRLDFHEMVGCGVKQFSLSHGEVQFASEAKVMARR